MNPEQWKYCFDWRLWRKAEFMWEGAEAPAMNYLNEQQNQFNAIEHNRNSQELQKLNYVAGELLIELRWCDDKLHERRRTQVQIGHTAQWMMFLMEKCERTCTNFTQSRPQLIKMQSRLVCQSCQEEIPTSAKMEQAHEKQPRLVQHPIWRAQVEFLLGAINKVGLGLLQHRLRYAGPERFPECLMQLKSALLRQQRHLRTLAGEHTQFGHEDRADKCERCGKRIEEQTVLHTATGFGVRAQPEN